VGLTNFIKIGFWTTRHGISKTTSRAEGIDVYRMVPQAIWLAIMGIFHHIAVVISISVNSRGQTFPTGPQFEVMKAANTAAGQTVVLPIATLASQPHIFYV
jgi:hypothetical protein